MGATVIAFAEQRGGEFKKSAFEVVSEAVRLAQQLGGEAAAVVLGKGVADAALAGLGAYGVGRVIVADDAALERYNGDLYGKVMADIAKKEGPQVVLFSATAMGKDLAPRVAARLDTGIAADITGTKVAGGKFTAKKPVYAGKSYVTIEFQKAPAVCSLRPNNFDVNAKNGGAAKIEKAAVDASGVKSRCTEVKAAGGGKADVSEASIIVAGGRGMKGPEHFVLLEKIAAEIPGAVVGASRAVVDAGWRPHSEQVGQTGKTVSPNLYIAAGISGAIQHLAGMRTSKCIVAINKDPEAPIFKVADYGIVGDIFQVAPALEAEFKKVLH